MTNLDGARVRFVELAHLLRSIGPDTAIYNRPGDLHSAITGDTPLVAFYVLWN